ncbi:NAD-dependent deacetylase [Bacillus sp. FJAT-18017]|uniref:NAD-dependent protein deacylase n=1 Tax=Bacillus sp. FJAT-18017 TaxID=1705566 RepID=UPI0006AE09A5|nr:NAD-dependent protein deacylase [Bacillus sp. FJAT-18017]ALC90506.1 NAD-dependent deacetylase [Bacillus sp. FJAT-18017]
MEELKRFLDKATHTVVFTGAGMSTEAGLPDFRGTNGIWHGADPMQLASTRAMKENTNEFIKFYRHRVENLREHKPHQGHRILAKWEREGRIQSIITQNVDGYHHRAGNNQVSELHGTLRTCHCNDCGRRYPIDLFMEEGKSCEECGGFLRPSVVLFGEMLPEKAVQQAELEARRADLFIVMGSSLSVYPANVFPEIAKMAGAKLVIVNLEETELDNRADLVIHDVKIGELLQTLDQSF